MKKIKELKVYSLFKIILYEFIYIIIIISIKTNNYNL